MVLFYLFGYSQKRYTAILENPEMTLLTSGTLDSGKRYIIDTYRAGDDFLNVGGFNVSQSEFFCTGTTPNNWAHGSIVYEPQPPKVTVLENTIGCITWRRDDPGVYEAYLKNGFPLYKTAVYITNKSQSNTFFGGNWAQSGDPDGDGISDWVDFSVLDHYGSGADGQLYFTTIQIVVYE